MDAKSRRKEANLKRLYEACRLGRVDDVSALFREDTELDVNARLGVHLMQRSDVHWSCIL